jgi:uncharacterized protein YjbI with pentapeptide repeats
MAGPDIKAIDALPVPIPGKDPVAPEPDTKNLDALLDSLNGSAERFQTLWFSFLGLTLYLAIAAQATSHRALLLGEGQTLPILSIKVGLLPFFVITPVLYLIFHFYLLLMLLLLARTAAPFERELRRAFPNEATQEEYRARVGNAPFLQLLVGMKDERIGFNSSLLGMIAFITLMLAPLSTLVLMQMKFLPYHSFWITWWHRVIVIADASMPLVLWFRLVYVKDARGTPLLFRDRSPSLIKLALGVNFAVVACAFWLSFYEGRWAGEPFIGRANFAVTANGVLFGLFPDRLILVNETIVGDELLEKTKKEISSRGGDFVPTVKLDEYDLQAADLSGADLRGVSLSEAAMQGANLVGARLDGAILNNAQLEGANLRDAQARGIQLVNAKLEGALLGGARMEGANLGGAQLNGSDLAFAKLQGANLLASWLEGVDLFLAQLEGAELGFARLQGADLKGAQLQGAHLAHSETGDSEFDQTFVFRTDTNDANLSAAVAQLPQTDGVKVNERGVIEPLTQADLDMWIAAATEFAGEREKASIAERFARLKPAFQASEQDAADHAKWGELARQSAALDPTRAQHRRRLAAILGDLACKADGAPYVARVLGGNPLAIGRGQGSFGEMFSDRRDGVLERLRFARNSPQTCPAVAGFTEDDWQRLEPVKPAPSAPADH